jgi:hypothetical protein
MYCLGQRDHLIGSFSLPVLVHRHGERPPALPSKLDQPRLASGRSPDSRIVEFEIPSRAIRKTQPLRGVNPVVLLLELSRLQLRGSAGFSPASRTPDEKVIEECKEKSKQT